MLLRMRGLPPKTTINAETGLLKAVENSDPNAILWFDTIQISRKLINGRFPVRLFILMMKQHCTWNNVNSPSSIPPTRVLSI